MTEHFHDEKDRTSHTFSEIIRKTARNFPDSRFHPQHNGIHTNEHRLRPTADGTGTKPELAERLLSQECSRRSSRSYCL